MLKLEGCGMDGLMLDHFQGLMIILHCGMSTIDVGMELLQTEANRKAFSLDVSVVGLDVSEGLAGKGDGPAIVY